MRCDLSPRQVALGLAAVTLLSSAAARAVSIGVSSATVAQPGGAAQVCVSLVTGGEEVAGTQNDITFNPGVVSVAAVSACVINPEISDRAEGCEDEYRQVRYAMQTLFGPHVDRERANKVRAGQWLNPRSRGQ